MKKRKQLSLLTAVADLFSEGVVLYDLESQQVIHCNEAATVLTGIKPNDTPEQINRLWRQVVVQDRAYLSAQFHAVQKEQTSRSAEFGMEQGKSVRRYLQATGAFLKEESLLTVMLRDITHLKEHEDYLVEFGAKKNTLLDTLTHNLSGSLNLTKHLATQAEHYASNASRELPTVLGLIKENNEGSLKIIDDFLQYEHESSPQIYLKATRIDVVEKIGFVYEQLRHSYPHRIFVFTFNRPEIHATTDEVKLLQVINNLASNAVKFSESGQPIAIHIEAKPDKVEISVADQGIGIPDALQPLIFLRQPATGRAGLNGERSHGKGLAICKHLIDIIKGEIWFDSNEGKGSTFYITLPYTLGEESNIGQPGL